MANPSFVYNPPMTPYLDILYQDDDMVVAHKPSGLLSVPGKALEHRDSLISRVNLVYPTATVVHRLDMATSGILVLALNKDAIAISRNSLNYVKLKSATSPGFMDI